MRRTAWHGACAAALLAGAPAWAGDATPRVQLAQAAAEFNIPAQSLADALTEFGRQSGLRVTVDAALVRGLSSPALSGTMAPADALSQLLIGTGLAGRFAESDLIVIERIAFDGEDAIHLGPVTVLGSRQQDAPLSNVPSSITILDQEDIQDEAATTNRVDDILARTVPGLNPTNNGVRMIRGRTAQVFINGVPTNEQLRAGSGSDINLVTADQISGVEVSRGANSAYGFGSPGGIIALATPQAQSEELTFQTRVRESFNPHHVEGSSQASLYQSVSQIVGDFDFQLGGVIAYDGSEYDPDGDLALGFNNAALMVNGKETLYNLDGSFGLDLGDAGALRLTGTFGYVDFNERYTLNPGVYREEYGHLTEDPIADESFQRSYTVNLNYVNENVLGSAVKLELFTSRNKVHTFESYGGDNYRQEMINEYIGFRSSATTPLDFILPDASVTYGVDLLRNNYFNPYYNNDTGAIVTYFAPYVTLDQIAPYLQLEVPIGDVILSGGVRHEEYSGHIRDATEAGGATGGDIQDFNLTLFNAGLVYSPIEQIDLYATFSQGAEVTQLGRAARDAASADQVDAQAAKSNQYELGMRGQWQDLALGLAGFYTHSDLLSAVECDGLSPCTPLREPREFWGIEANADWRIDDQWTIGGVFTWQDGIRELDDGTTQRVASRDIPPILVTAYVEYSPFEWWRNRLQLNYRADRDPFGDSVEYGEGRVDDEFLVNASAAFDAGPGELRIGVENLLNETYTSIPSGSDNSGFLWVPEEGTRLSISYAMTW